MEKTKTIKVIFFINVLLFILLIIALILCGLVLETRCPLFLPVSIVWSLFGLILLVLAVKSKAERKLKKFLIFAGASALGFFVSALLHNVFFGLNEVYNNVFLEIFQILFFLVSVFVCPILFLIGTIGSIVLFAKNK